MPYSGWPPSLPATSCATAPDPSTTQRSGSERVTQAQRATARALGTARAAATQKTTVLARSSGAPVTTGATKTTASVAMVSERRTPGSSSSEDLWTRTSSRW